MSNNLYSVVQYENAAGATDFTITFPYLRRQHVFVYLNDVSILRPVDFEFESDSLIRLTTPLQEGDVLTIRRFTWKDTLLATYYDGSILTDFEMNDVSNQLLYLIQEANDYRVIQENGGNVPGGDGSDPLTPGEIDQIIAQILQSQLFQDLIELIDLVDIQAEVVMSRILDNHFNWSQDERREQILRDLGIATGENNATIAQLETTILDDNQAFTEQINLLNSQLDTQQASILQINSTLATQDTSIASLFTELQAVIYEDDLETLLSQSSYISGIEATATAQSAEIAAIESYLVGVGDFQDPDPNSFAGSVSAIQTTVDAQADEISTQGSVLFAMASRFGDGTLDPPEALAAAIANSYETYADEESATATNVQDLMANSHPIYFSETPPNYQEEPWLSSPYVTTGFPNGTTWYYSTVVANRRQLRTFVFYRGVNIPTQIEGMDGDSLGVDFFPIAGVNNQPSGTGFGAWVNTDSVAIGAMIRQIADVNITTGSASARLRDLVEVVWAGRVSAIEQTTESYFDEETGLLNSQWMVRANQFSANLGTPVVAGFGLGLQSNPDNPDQGSFSNFIVMADNFSVVAPPQDGDVLGGEVPLADVLVPFVVDADGNVYVNTNLIVEDNLYSYGGRIRQAAFGRAIFGQMEPNPTPDEQPDPQWNNLVDPDGYRMELLSSTDGFWTGPSRNYLMWAGTGNRNDNNAVFYIDSEGNALFGGVVQAENINGSLSNVDFQNVVASPAVVVPKNTAAWSQVGPTQEFEVTSLRLLKVVLQASVKMLDSKTGSFRLMARYEQTAGGGNYTSWTELDRANRDHDRKYFENEVQLWGVIAENMRGKVQYRVEMSNPFDRGDSPDVTSDGYKALIMALPQSSTAAAANAPAPDPGDTGAPGGGSPPPSGGTDPTGPGVIITP